MAAMVDDAPAAAPPAYDDLGLGDDDDDEDLERLGLRDAAPAPAAPAAGDGAPPPNHVTRDARDPDRRFCPQCGNTWQPRESRADQTLLLHCRNCGYAEPAHSPVVYENRIKKEVSTRLDTINPEVTQDPTLQRMRGARCESCGHDEAVLFQAESGAFAASLSLIFVCCGCGYSGRAFRERRAILKAAAPARARPPRSAR